MKMALNGLERDTKQYQEKIKLKYDNKYYTLGKRQDNAKMQTICQQIFFIYTKKCE